MHHGICALPACSQPFESRVAGRLFCSRACYVKTPQFLARMTTGRANAKGPQRQGDTRSCAREGCTVEFYGAKSSPRRYCTRLCHRIDMEQRFDRWAAAPGTFRDLSGYDEFLMQDRLPCLVNGCDWSGDNLSLHMNLEHGVKARDFKQLAGFNMTTGVISPSMMRRMLARPHTSKATITKRGTWKPGAPRSRESVEHFEKAMALRAPQKEAPTE